MTCVPGEENSCVIGGIYSTFNRKEALFTPSDSAPDIMRNGLQLLARHSLQHYTARVTVNPKSRDQDDDVKPSESRGSSNTATAWPSDRALDEPSRRNLLSDLSVVHRRTLLINLPRLIL